MNSNTPTASRVAGKNTLPPQALEKEFVYNLQ